MDDGWEAKANIELDMKRIALHVCKSIVTLQSESGEDEKKQFVCSGTIMKRRMSNSSPGPVTFIYTILTSATLLRIHSKDCSHSGAAVVPHDIKVRVTLADGQVIVSNSYSYDLHYNLAIITISYHESLPTAFFRYINTSMLANPNAHVDMEDSMEVDTEGGVEVVSLFPGDEVLALGRHGRELRAAPGVFSVYKVGFQCEMLFQANCKIGKSGIGGPLINYEGEVIGINFYHTSYTPFLPSNLASICFNELSRRGTVRSRPSLGMEMTNLHVASLAKLEKIIQMFPDIRDGVIIETVKPESPAYRAGILVDDVIVECEGKPLRDSLEFFGIMLRNTEASVKLVVLRASDASRRDLNMVVDQTSPASYYEWPVPEDTPVKKN